MQDRRFADSRALSEATRCLFLSVHLSVSVTPSRTHMENRAV